MAQHGGKKIRGDHGRRHHTNGATQVAGTGSSGGFSVLDLVQDGPHAGQVGVSRFGQRQLARGALQQARAQVLLQVGHQPGHHRGREFQQTGGRRKTTLINNGLEHPHGQKSIHLGNYSSAFFLIVSFFGMINCRACYFSKGKP